MSNQIKATLDNGLITSSKFQPVMQSRWNEANINSLFYAGSQTYVNRYFGTNLTSSQHQYYFNICQQPVNMITGHERQHRKNFNIFLQKEQIL